ncbi:hypothetical protein CBR_g8188 [Chara braunii]|uniref:Uncharacterized protein n=1 Tax=Chara braunii TaxID=69332 RepID=A0A388KLL5_CHABU|nr:hypothetical protein CBR_g8188 [Chara braunii]|eukprot:GBG70888.1 hypothetical protein CBR_g8188 [Chara braunii]
MGRVQRRQHEAAPEHVQETLRGRSPVYWYLVVGQKVDNKEVIMSRCTFCNKVFQRTQYQATRHFSQTEYCKDVNDEALYEITRKTQQKFMFDQMERVAWCAVERGLDAPRAGGARGGEAEQRLEGGGRGDGGQGASDRPSGGGGGNMVEDVIHIDHEARGLGEEGLLGHEDAPEFHPATWERMVDWMWRAAKGAVPVPSGLREDGPSKRKEGGADPAATHTEKRLRHSPRAVLPNHSEIPSMHAVETHHAELAKELEEVRQPFWVTGATILFDGRKSQDGRPIANFLDARSRGAVMYMTINREGEPDDAVHVLQRWDTIFHEFRFGGPQQVNAICTDSTSTGAASIGRAPSMDEATGETGSRTSRERTAAESPDEARDITKRERARLMASSDPRAQTFVRALEERRRRETGRDGQQGGVVAGAVRTDVTKAVAAEAVDKVVVGGPQTVGEAVVGGPQTVDEAVEAGHRRDGGAGDSRAIVHDTTSGQVVAFLGLQLAEARQLQPAEVAVHDVSFVVITDLGFGPLVVRSWAVA